MRPPGWPVSSNRLTGRRQLAVAVPEDDAAGLTVYALGDAFSALGVQTA